MGAAADAAAGRENAVKEKELRLALVCYGGVSLAVYMHGVTRELLNLVRASKVLHAERDLARRATMSYTAANPHEDRECDSESAYFELIQAIGARLDLRVIIDVISGASAGGINGVILARALAHDLPIESLRDLWLKRADITELMDSQVRAKNWSKWYLKPFIWGMSESKLLRLAPDAEMRQKVSTFLRSRWFKPPFDGPMMAELLYRGIDGMGRVRDLSQSLLPSGQALDLFVTVTDFYGHLINIPLHNPPMISEREHRHVLAFSYQRWPNGDCISEMNDEWVPALAFAARATSAYPGAFPAAQLREMEAAVHGAHKHWTTLTEFVRRNFREYFASGADPTKTSFIDGSVLNNKPFAEAIEAIKGRPAYRQVDRRLVYIDPNPRSPPPPPSGRLPGFFKTIAGALSEIPRNEPIHNEINYVNGFNVRVRRLRTIIDATRPQIMRLVGEVTQDALTEAPTIERLRHWREAVNARAAKEAGFAYEGYIRIKLTAVLDSLTTTIAGICNYPVNDTGYRFIEEALQRWALDRGIHRLAQNEGETFAAATGLAQDPAEAPPPVRFLWDFDADFRRRRLRFVVQSLNQMYRRLDESDFNGTTVGALDRLKRRLYDALDRLRLALDRDRLTALMGPVFRPLLREARNRFGPLDAARWADTHGAALDEALAGLAQAIDLRDCNREVDEIFVSLGEAAVSPVLRREMMMHYLGFAFWDVLTFSITQWRDLGEYDEIRVNRISPEDAQTIRRGGARATLRGTQLASFGAFFSRKFRENDYLWGRLHAADRLLDILYDAGRIEGAVEGIDLLAIKKRAFLLILETEERFLGEVPDLIRALRREVEAL
jgi:patatin-related protein